MSTEAIINVEISFLGSEDPRKDRMKYAEIQEPSDLVFKVTMGSMILVIPRLCDKWNF